MNREHQQMIFDDPDFFLMDFLVPHLDRAREVMEKVTEREIWRDVWDAAVQDWCEMHEEFDREEARLDEKHGICAGG